LKRAVTAGFLKRGDTLVVATHNQGKIRELHDLIAPYGVAIAAAGDIGLPEPEETGVTFEANAMLKAIAAAIGSGQPSLADDSGVAVDALDGAPGIHSARWAGPEKDFARAMRRVEDGLVAAGAATPEKRGAKFVAVLCLAFPNGATETWRGEVKGTMIWPPRGTNGFGYDPMFVPEGETRTFGELTQEEKHGKSHRAKAFALFAKARLPRL
jgi:XTP/dITP diphosphohydrolase